MSGVIQGVCGSGAVATGRAVGHMRGLENTSDRGALRICVQPPLRTQSLAHCIATLPGAGQDKSKRLLRRRFAFQTVLYAEGVSYAEQTHTERTDAIALLRKLIDIDSTTFHEGAAGLFLAEYLCARGFSVETTPVQQPEGSSHTGERLNVYAAAQPGDPVVVLSTHMDTVPPWMPSREDEDWVYGRGACDAKGIIVAMILAAEQLRERAVPVALLFVVGEERDSAGAKVANLRPRGSRFLINGEPTENRVAVASKGALRASVRAQGTMAHSAYPELGDSAVHKLVRALDAILDVPLPAVDDVGPSTLNIGLVEGGRAPNVIADEASALVLVRLVGPSTETRAAIEAAAAPHATVDFTLEIPFVRLRAIEGLPTMVAAFTTDIPALTEWGEPLLLGPGSIHVAHTPGERIAKADLWEAVSLYVAIAERLAATVVTSQ
jgi:acetylornithine deacetylase